jgi:hypothetical protein
MEHSPCAQHDSDTPDLDAFVACSAKCPCNLGKQSWTTVHQCRSNGRCFHRQLRTVHRINAVPFLGNRICCPVYHCGHYIPYVVRSAKHGRLPVFRPSCPGRGMCDFFSLSLLRMFIGIKAIAPELIILRVARGNAWTSNTNEMLSRTPAGGTGRGLSGRSDNTSLTGATRGNNIGMIAFRKATETYNDDGHKNLSHDAI